MSDAVLASPRRKVGPEELNSQNQAEIGDSDFFIGGRQAQARFFESVEFGLRMFGDERCNIFVTGIESPDALKIVGRHVADCVNKLGSNGASVFPEPQDYCYVHNFKDPRVPKLIILPRGAGNAFKSAMGLFPERFKEEIMGIVFGNLASLESRRMKEELSKWSADCEKKICKDAEKIGFIVEFHIQQEGSFSVAPGRPSVDGGGLTKFASEDEVEEYLSKMSESEKTEFNQKRSQALDMAMEHLKEYMRRFGDCNRKMKDSIKKQVAVFCEETFGEFEKTFSEKFRSDALFKISKFLKGLKRHVVRSYADFLPKNGEEANGEMALPIRDPNICWKVNVVVDNSATKDIPVVFENTPTHGNLVGGLDSKVMFGGFAVTDHTHIRAGSVAKANGGCIVISLNYLAGYPAALPALFDSIRNKNLGIKDMASSVGYDSHLPLRPEPIPLSLRVVLCGSRDNWRILNMLARDHGFDLARFFEAKAEALPFVEADPHNIPTYAAWIRKFSKDKNLSSLDDSAVGRLIEESMRLSGSRLRLSTDFEKIKRIMLEASDSKLASGDSKNPLSARHIIDAIEKRFWRLNFTYEMMLRQISEGKKIINVEGEKVGEIDGLAVSDLGDIEVGLPSRIAASVYPSAKPGMITIERESKLSGSIFDKADFTVRESLKARYASRAPLALGISFTFEQSYHGIDGDSASLAEFYSIISALSEFPIKQGIAITGSMSLHGDVQPIGGVNEKIEGFFDVCRSFGKLDGRQGVIIPYQNTDNLMLRDDVAESVKKGEFNVWPIKNLDEGARILMGASMEDLDLDVCVRLRDFAEITRSQNGEEK